MTSMSSALIIFFVLMPSFVFAQFGKDMKVIARGLNVRTAAGDILCSIKKDDRVEVIGRHADGQRLKVSINKKGCPKQGYVYSNFLKPDNILSKVSSSSKVEVDSLSLRSSPKVNHKTYLCALPKDAVVDIVDDVNVGAHRSQWFKVKVKTAVKGCPAEGFVNGAYLVPNEDFKDLPEAIDSKSVMAMEQNTEAQVPCKHCETTKSPTAIGTQIVDVVTPPERNDFIEGLKEMIKDSKAKPDSLITHRGLVQMPLIGNRGNIGACGSHHYNPDKPVGIDAYANPVTACAFVSFLQDWKKNSCPNNDDGCRIAWGDISHKTRPKFSGHQTHTDGQCIDIRPLRSGGFADAPMTYRQKIYDRAKTQEMIRELKAKGASVVLFNDPKSGGEYTSGHDNHIHVCFYKNEKTLNTCNGLILDPNVCPELE